MKFFIDFENVGTAGLKGIEKLSGRDCVVLFISDHTTEKGVMKMLSSTRARIRIEYVSTTAKNAMDFCLISSVGAEIARGRKNICIVSSDRGYNAACSFWSEHGVEIGITGNIAGDPCRYEETASQETVCPAPVIRSVPVKKLPKNAECILGQFLKDNFESLSKDERKKFRKVLVKESGANCQKTLTKLKISKKKAVKTENFLISNGIRQAS